MTNEEIRNRLFELKDEKYKEFTLKLIPGLEPDNVIGVRTPKVAQLTKEIIKSGDYSSFLDDCPHKYYEEMGIHVAIINSMKDYDSVIREIDRFIPYVDNWATCDGIKPRKAFSKNCDRLIIYAKMLIKSEHIYTKRFGIEMIMNFFLDDNFKREYNDLVASIRSDEYYINMMIAWYFATALAKQYNDTIPFIENRRLDEWTHKKTIQKARESYRITEEQKEYLKSLK